MLRYCLPLILAASALPGMDLTVTPRFSLGIAEGWGITQKEVNKEVEDMIAAGWDNGAVNYEVKSAVNIEVPILFTLRQDPADVVGFVVGPALYFSQNKNSFDMTASNTPVNGGGWLKYNGDDTLQAVGAKVYVGVAFGKDQAHGEVLAWVGSARMKEKVEGTVTNSVGGRATVSESSTGTATLYGIGFGGYVHVGERKQIQLGGRIGYAGGTVTIDDTDYDQSGMLLALEAGLSF